MEKVISWNGYELKVRDFELSHANGGRLGKIWAEDIKSGRVFLIKGSGKSGYEPFSEKIAYIIGKNLGIDVLEYDIMPAEPFKGLVSVNPKCPYVSICEKIDKEKFCMSSIAEIKRARNVIVGDKKKSIRNREVMYEILPKEYIDTMLLFDAIIGNEDRHYGNVHVIRGVDGQFVGAPILDNGASLLATRSNAELMFTKRWVGELYNRSFTIDTTHDKQLETVDSINNIDFNITSKCIQIIDEIQPTLDLMDKVRADAIKRYIVYRLHKYLGMIKYSDSKKYLIGTKRKRTIREREISHV